MTQTKKKSSKAKKRRIWIVEGQTGQYSDHYNWSVVAYASKAKAVKHAKNASARAKEIFDAAGGKVYGGTMEKNKYDPHMNMDYTGTTYNAYPVNLVE